MLNLSLVNSYKYQCKWRMKRIHFGLPERSMAVKCVLYQILNIYKCKMLQKKYQILNTEIPCMGNLSRLLQQRTFRLYLYTFALFNYKAFLFSFAFAFLSELSVVSTRGEFLRVYKYREIYDTGK